MAELGNIENIIVGAASIYISNTPGASDDITTKPPFAAEGYGDTLETDPWSASETNPVEPAAWRHAGFTQEGLEVSYEPQYGDVEVDQLLDSVVTFKQSMKVMLNTTLAEATLYNLMVAWGQSASTLTSDASSAEIDIDGGSLGEFATERGFVAVGVSPREGVVYGERVYHAYRTLNVEQSTISAKRNENTGIPVSFRALPASTGLYGKIKDRKRTW